MSLFDCLCKTRAQLFDKLPHIAASIGERLSGIDHIIGACPLVAIVHLQREDMFEFFRRHAGTREHALTLNLRRCRYHDGDIDPLVAACFEQQGYIKNNHVSACVLFQKIRSLPRDRRVNQRLKLCQPVAIT